MKKPGSPGFFYFRVYDSRARLLPICESHLTWVAFPPTDFFSRLADAVVADGL